MEEHRATPILTRTHAHTPHTHIHTQQRPVCVGPTWALPASARAQGGQAQHPGGADTAAPASTGAGVAAAQSWARASFKELPSRWEGLFSAPDLCPWSLPCPASCRLHLGKKDNF